MKRISLLIVVMIATIFTLQSCKNDKSDVKETAREQLSKSKDKVANASVNPKDLINKKIEEPVGPTTTIEFKNKVYDFGKVMEGEIVEHDFVFTNTGNEPLILKKVKASCGCTTPSWPRTAIAPGAIGKIHARFDTKRRGRVGGKPENKRITVTANLEGGKVVLSLKGTIDKDPKVAEAEAAKKAAAAKAKKVTKSVPVSPKKTLK